ncbi:hypothetical protein BO70DRAFT_97003 [Aspergillus heteromorphus CBS 117.55]|uniref:Uncharacterized protein n=1 Tax=Aspergillus heteromorphus CBS 117.55 TaxID=1448321 RepID=A0A317VRB1_9EURO|nr:uncharacterized protein BO70DRAFT_97003 [Aspergillus heteromorphus CBS 117.55]PWY75432.1 hypothetical protein BO70DRAFT_97003 [Aspergillus heteromorphus CBS 117.55]
MWVGGPKGPKRRLESSIWIPFNSMVRSSQVDYNTVHNTHTHTHTHRKEVDMLRRTPYVHPRSACRTHCSADLQTCRFLLSAAAASNSGSVRAVVAQAAGRYIDRPCSSLVWICDQRPSTRATGSVPVPFHYGDTLVSVYRLYSVHTLPNETKRKPPNG